jgi:hypothetical protein
MIQKYNNEERMKKIKEKEKIKGKEEERGETEMADPFRREEEEIKES